MTSGTTQLCAVIGDPVSHSLSPQLFSAAFAACELDWTYVAFPVAAPDLAAALEGARALGIRGLSVTMPHKEKAAELCDELSPSAAALGAVNCVVVENSRLVGHNTDGDGLIDSLQTQFSFSPVGKNCVVIGAGGAGRSIALALGAAGAAQIGIVNRSAARAEMALALAGAQAVHFSNDDPRIREADLIVNATPVGMESVVDQSMPIDSSFLHSGQVIVDTVYRPLKTEFLHQAEKAGARFANGVPMLAMQAARQFELWTQTKAPRRQMLNAVTRFVAS